ncbi:prepilin-type N-terminal cleavage/methylation domain-containing protein [Candidatus Pelagibacter sp.]|nr:prepilin-type N-terminal cleavage/methylation domain-containing protein [Candidatus Pelagibacter sp.]
MQVLEKNIKGFNLIELLVVIAIISVISAAAYPNFSSWKKAREVRGAAIKIKSLFTNINSQVQRGLYGFIQVEVTASTTGGEVIVISKGMKLSKLASKINNSDDDWNTDLTSRCALDQDWDDEGMNSDGSKSSKLEVNSLKFDNIAINFEDKSGTVCFSKDGTWYSAAEQFESSGVFFICEGANIKCDVKEDGDPNNENHDNLFALNWSRFGNVTLEKWSKSKSGWVLQ